MNTVGNYTDALANIDTLRDGYNEAHIDRPDWNKCAGNVIARIDDYCFAYGIPVQLDWVDHDEYGVVTGEQHECVLGGLTLILEGNAQGGLSSDGEYEFTLLPGYELDIHGAYIVASEEH